MVANANIKAAFSGRDLRSSATRMELMVPKLLDDIHASGGRWRPDVVLLQEAIRRERFPGDSPDDDLSALRVATELGFATGDPYGIVVDPGTLRPRGRRISRETAIVANLETMRWITGGFVATSGFKRSRPRKGVKLKRPRKAPGRRQAWALLAESDPEGLTFPVSSVHLLTHRRLNCRRGERCTRKINRLKRTWTRQVSGRLAVAGAEAAGRAVIGGDFNAKRRDRFHAALLDRGYLRAVGARIDFIFSRLPALAAGKDVIPTGGGRYRGSYSDHPFLWASFDGG